jgi:phenylpropionate dioxygenase-like ring-hydroxylating dioxygenase large terminal subunit
VTERHGMVFLVPEAPLALLPVVAVADDPAFMGGVLTTIVAGASAGLPADFLDIAHCPFAHAGTIGVIEAIAGPHSEVRRDEWGFTMEDQHRVRRTHIRAGSPVSTTGRWYRRLGRALSHQRGGALSRALAAPSDLERSAVRSSMTRLPEEIGLVSLRRLVPIMQALPGQPNLLAAGAVAVALLLGAELHGRPNHPF